LAVSVTSQIFISDDYVNIAAWKWKSAVWSGSWTLPPEVQIRLHLPVGTIPHQTSPTHRSLAKGIIFETFDGKHISLRNRQVKNFVPNYNTSLILSHALNNKTEEHLSPNFIIFKFDIVVISSDVYRTLPSTDNKLIYSFNSLN
jgi:hypothetical protein